MRFLSSTVPGMDRTGTIALWFFLLLLPVSAGCQKESPRSPEPTPVVPVSHPVERMVTDSVDFTGRTDAIQSVNVIARATGSTLSKADELGCRSVALVAFGTGVGGFPLAEAARLMVDAVRQHQPDSVERVVFAVHGAAAERAFSDAVQA